MAPSCKSVLELREVSWTARGGDDSSPGELYAANLQLPSGICAWISGPVGEGKEQLFRLLNLEQRPDTGTALVDGADPARLGMEALANFRAQKFGFVSLNPFLIPSFSAIENIAVPLMKVTRPTLEDAQERIAALLRFVQLEELAESPASALSPLDQARLVLARALVNGPLAVFVEDLGPQLQPCDCLLFASQLRQCAEEFDVTFVAMDSVQSCAVAGDRRVEVAGGRISRDVLLMPVSPS